VVRQDFPRRSRVSRPPPHKAVYRDQVDLIRWRSFSVRQDQWPETKTTLSATTPNGGCRERNKARKAQPAAEPRSVDGIQAIVQRLKTHGQTDRQQTRPMAGLPGQPPFFPFLCWISWFALHPPSGTPVANPSARLPVSPPLSIPRARWREWHWRAAWCEERPRQGTPRFLFHLLSHFYFPFAFPSSPPPAWYPFPPSRPASTTLGSLGIGTSNV
jgi:hypothetical protein